MLDEPNPSPFKIFKRAFGLPKEWQMPPGLFDVFPYMHEQIKNALSAATADELEEARVACRFPSRVLDKPENWRRGAIVVGGAPLPWRPIKLASLMWRSQLVRAATSGLVILGMRNLKSALGEKTTAALASAASEISSLWPERP
jgi:hypothetical protein